MRLQCKHHRHHHRQTLKNITRHTRPQGSPHLPTRW
jgi:hypothetical protein